jgi:hypothetical protein
MSADVQNSVTLAFRHGIPAEFTSLFNTILDKSKSNPMWTLRSVAGELSTHLKGLAPADRITMGQDSALFTSLFAADNLTAQLQAIEDASGRPAPMVLRRAEATVGALSKASAAPNATEADEKRAAVFKEALMTPEVVGKLEELKRVAGSLTDVFKPGVHIIQAWYGHLGTRPPKGSQCEATGTMVPLCEGKPSCAAPAVAGGGTLLDPVAICGFDPASYARGLARGLRVKYSCESGGPELWDQLARNRLINPDTGKEYDKDNSYTVELRSSAMKINCAFPVAE